MSVYLNNDTDGLMCTATSSFGVGSGSISFTMWFKFLSAPAPASEILSLTASGTNAAGPILPFKMQNQASPVLIQAANDQADYIGTYNTTGSSGAWMGLVTTHTSGSDNLRIRVFSDSTNSTPLTDDTRTQMVYGMGSAVRHLVFGALQGGQGTTECKVANLKMITNVELTNAQARQELDNYTIQTNMGANSSSFNWKLSDISTTTDGLYEINGVGPNFINTGSVTDSDMPNQLSSAGIGGFNMRIDQLGTIQTRIGPSERNVFYFNV